MHPALPRSDLHGAGSSGGSVPLALFNTLKWLRYSWLLPQPRSLHGCMIGWIGTTKRGTEMVGTGRDLLELFLMLENLKSLGVDIWQPYL